MSEQAVRVEPQYLLAAAQSAATYYQAIWQKIGYVLAIQSGGIAATYVVRLSWWTIAVMAAAFIFSCAPLLAAEYDIRNRDKLIDQVDHIAKALCPLFEQARGITFEFEPFRIDELLPAPSLSYTTWLVMRIVLVLRRHRCSNCCQPPSLTTVCVAVRYPTDGTISVFIDSS